MRKVIMFMAIILLGCEPTLDKESSYMEVVETLTENFNDKKPGFEKILLFYRENWVPGIKEKFHCLDREDDEVDFTTTEYYKKSYSDEEKEWYLKSREVCELQFTAKIFFSNKAEDLWVFYTYMNRHDGYFNWYDYGYSEETLDDEGVCKGDDPKNKEEKGRCFIPLNDHWFINYTFGRIPKEMLERYKSRPE